MGKKAPIDLRPSATSAVEIGDHFDDRHLFADMLITLKAPEQEPVGKSEEAKRGAMQVLTFEERRA